MGLSITATIYRNRPNATGSFPVVLRLTYKRQSAYIPTSYFCAPRQLTRDGKSIADASLLMQVAQDINEVKRIVSEVEPFRDYWTVKDIVNYVKSWTDLKKDQNEEPDLILYMRGMVERLKSEERYWQNINATINSIEKFRGIGHFRFSECTTKWLYKYEEWLLENSGKRAASQYITQIRTAFNQARREFNDEDEGVILIKNYPFSTFKIVDRSMPQSRALSAVDIARIAEFELERKPHDHSTCMSRVEVAKNTFMLSFYLCGINTADIYEIDGELHGFLEYERRKTRTRRKDRAKIKIAVPPEAEQLSQVKHYGTYQQFNKSVNLGLHQIRSVLMIENLTFYSARHSWATIAHNELRIPLSVVTLALNQSLEGDNSAKVTTRYIRKDFSIVDDANRKVISYVNTCRKWLRTFRRIKVVIQALKSSRQ